MASRTKENTGEQCLNVYYNGACPLCRREINVYRGFKGADAISWVDVSEQNVTELEKGLTREAALMRFHVKRRDGKLVSGAFAFAQLWMALPALSWAGKVVSLPGVCHIADAFYSMFLIIRPLLQKITPRRTKSSECIRLE